MMEYDPDRVQDAARKSSLRWCDDVQRMKDLGLMFVVVVQRNKQACVFILTTRKEE